MAEQKKDIGGLWAKTGKSGVEFLAGNIEIDGVKHEVVLFRNDRKKPGERTPDWRVYPSTPREARLTTGGGNDGW